MNKQVEPVVAVVEEWMIPTYPSPAAEEMPMFAELRGHQITSGNPYPHRVVTNVDREHRAERPYTVVRLENEYIRVAIIPELGGRVFEAYDKTTGYDFLYRQHVVKPALIGAYGSWISGGLEFNWPYHHRPSTMMPVDFRLEKLEDGSAAVWLSEHDPCHRMKGTVGIILRPGTSYFETRVDLSNRTPYKHSFLWWENAAVGVHDDYRLVFPPDVTWVHHHYDRSHTTFPLASGVYGADNLGEENDITWYKNTRLANSYFAAPSKYDFFGGFDYRKNCGVLHIANHHISPGKKLFAWGNGPYADTWEERLTDTDGQYAELMAGSYTDDQPDFTWLAPYENKTFSQYWYPTQGIGYTSYATLEAAVALERGAGEVRFNATAAYPGAHVTVKCECGEVLLDEKIDLVPSVCVTRPLTYPEGKLSVTIVTAEGDTILSYTEEEHDQLHIPKNNPGLPRPDALTTPMELTIAGKHLDQYRDAHHKPDIYYLEALRKDPDFLPALSALGEYYCRVFRFEDALPYLERASKVECRYNPRPEDGTVRYLLGTAYLALGQEDKAYDIFYQAFWSQNVISPAMTFISAIDGKRGDYDKMLTHALKALEKEDNHPIAWVYAALAFWRMGDTRTATETLRMRLETDPMNHLARYALACVTGRGKNAFYDSLFSNPAQTALDIGFDLLRAGFVDECISLFNGVLVRCPNAATLRYALAYCYEQIGESGRAARQRKLATREKIVDVFPSRFEEATVLADALARNPKDGFAAYLLGCYWQHARVYERAAELYEVAIANLPGFYIPYRNLAILYFNRFDRQAEALKLMNRALALHPNDERLIRETVTVMEYNGVPATECAKFIEENIPENAGDLLTLTFARICNAARDYEKTLSIMANHNFYPPEDGEYQTAYPYMYAHHVLGLQAMKAGEYEKALAEFRAAMNLPANLHTGFSNENVLIPYRYGEVCALKALGRDDEAAPLIDKILAMRNTGAGRMGEEFSYYVALTTRLAGKELQARSVMRNAILSWEAQLAKGFRYHLVGSNDFACFLPNQAVTRRAAVTSLLGLGKLFFGDTEAAVELFNRALEIDPTNVRAALQLDLLA